MRVRIDYGATGIDAEIPDANLIGVLNLPQSPPLPDPDAAIAHALSNPIGTQSLAILAQNRESAVIVICDITRPVPNKRILPPMLQTLEAAGIPPDKITILIATGTHRPNWGEELHALIGEELAARYPVVNHDSQNPEMHYDLGVSPNGVPIRLDKTYCDADLKLTVGLIEPHFMAGYSGGRKLVMPGVAAFSAIQRWHCPKFLEHPNATMGIVAGNPVHEETLAIVKTLPPDLICDVTLNAQNEITGVFAGDLEQAWLAGVAYAAQHVRVPCPEPADIVVTSSAGAPLDATYYQTVKGMVGALPIVKRGGSIIIASECKEGIGSADFTRAVLETTDLEDFVAYISQPDVFVPEEWQVEELARAARHAHIYCLSGGIPAETLAQCFVTPIASIEEGIALALERHGANARIAVIPRGPYVIPHLTHFSSSQSA